MKRLKILLLEDSVLDAELTTAMLVEGGFEFDCVRVETRDDFVRELERGGWDLILADYALPTFDGLTALRIAVERARDIPFIFVSGTLGEDLAIESLKNGATDYVLKQRLQRLVPCVRRALQEVQERRELKHAHEALIATEKLAVVGRLAATIAHEINNPLEAATNLLYLLETNGNLDEEARNLLALANRELGRVADITRQTLSFYRESIVPVEVKLDEVLLSVLTLYERKFKDARAEVHTEIEADHPVRAYPGEMRQVFSNLLNNALEALSGPGKLRIRLRRARDGRTGEPGLRLIIADNGAGIAPEHRKLVFEPFFTTKGEKGTGLGLWVTRGIVQKHHGHIRLRSSQRDGRRGTVFSLFFRVTATTSEPPAASGEFSSSMVA